jgi:hypothetical protein
VNLRFGTIQMGNYQFHRRLSSVGSSFTLTSATHGGTTDKCYANGVEIMNLGGKWTTIDGCSPVGNLARGYNDDTYFAGDIAEVIVYTRELNSQERQTLEQYLAGKYGLTVPLPPKIVSQPLSLTVSQGNAAAFHRAGGGCFQLPMAFPRAAYSGREQPHLRNQTRPHFPRAGDYQVVVSGPYGSVASDIRDAHRAHQRSSETGSGASCAAVWCKSVSLALRGRAIPWKRPPT